MSSVPAAILNESNLMNAALAYAEKGWPVFPLHSIRSDGRCSCGRQCKSPGKHPRNAKGFLKATTDTKRIRDWWTKWPTANIGLRTGTDLYVLDIDPKNGGDASLGDLLGTHELPDTLTAETGGGGSHIYFRKSAELRNTAGRLGEGIDTRGDGGYVVAPPSNHKSGGAYTWRNWGAPIAPVPGWVLELLQGKKPAAVAIPEGTRNNTLLSIAGKLRQEGKSRQQIETFLLEENATRCKPPLEPEEVAEIAANAARYKEGGKSFKTEWQEAVMRDTSMKPFQRFALIGLSLHMNAEGRECFPSLDRLATELGVTRQALSAALKASDGLWIERYRRPKPKAEDGTQKWSYGYVAKHFGC